MTTEIDNTYATLRNRFWELDASIKKANAELSAYEKELSDMAVKEGEFYKRRQEIKKAKQEVMSRHNVTDMARERSRIAVFLDRKTGTAEAH